MKREKGALVDFQVVGLSEGAAVARDLRRRATTRYGGRSARVYVRSLHADGVERFVEVVIVRETPVAKTRRGGRRD